MKTKKMINNYIMVKLDPDNDFIKLPSGGKIYVDNTFEPEKHVVVVGEVVDVPENLKYSYHGHGMPWVTPLELKNGDRVVMYYLAVQNCLRKESKRYLKEGNTTWIFITYNNIFATIANGRVTPVNGYLLAEPMADPYLEKKKERLKKIGLEMVSLGEKSNKNVVYARIVYVGYPILKYHEPSLSDAGIEVWPGDEVVLKKVRDITAEYEYHAKIDKGRKLFRIQRHDILAKL